MALETHHRDDIAFIHNPRGNDMLAVRFKLLIPLGWVVADGRGENPLLP
jgi:hypothetical protein